MRFKRIDNILEWVVQFHSCIERCYPELVPIHKYVVWSEAL